MQTCSFATLVQMHATCPPRPSVAGPALDLLGSSNPSSKHRSISRCPAGQQAWLSSLQEPLSCTAAAATAGYLVFSSPPPPCFTSFT